MVQSTMFPSRTVMDFVSFSYLNASEANFHSRVSLWRCGSLPGVRVSREVHRDQIHSLTIVMLWCCSMALVLMNSWEAMEDIVLLLTPGAGRRLLKRCGARVYKEISIMLISFSCNLRLIAYPQEILGETTALYLHMEKRQGIHSFPLM